MSMMIIMKKEKNIIFDKYCALRKETKNTRLWKR